MVPPTPKRMMWRITEAPWRMLQPKVFVLFLCGVQLVLRSGVLTILDLDEVDVTPSFAEVFRSVLSRAGGSTGGWRCCWGAPVSLNCPLPLRRTHPPTLVCCFCVFAAMGVTSTNSGRLELNLSLFEKRDGKSHLGTILLSAVSGTWRFCMVILRCSLYLWKQCMILRSLFCW